MGHGRLSSNNLCAAASPIGILGIRSHSSTTILDLPKSKLFHINIVKLRFSKSKHLWSKRPSILRSFVFPPAHSNTCPTSLSFFTTTMDQAKLAKMQQSVRIGECLRSYSSVIEQSQLLICKCRGNEKWLTDSNSRVSTLKSHPHPKFH